MPRIDLDSVPVREGSGYPAQYAGVLVGRSAKRLADAGGLTQFGVNLVTLKPGAWASQRHWHEQEDEFVMMLSGELALVENEGETILRAGDCAAHKAGVANGHHLVNRSGADATFLVIGTRAETERAHYPDIDLIAVKEPSGFRYFRKDGTPF